MSEGAVEVVAVTAHVATAQFGLGDATEMADHREGDVRQRKPYQVALAGPRPVAIGGEKPGCGKAAHDRVPGRQDAVERAREVARTGGERESRGGVDGVVHLARPVRVAGQRDHHQVVPACSKRVVGQPATRGEVRKQGSGRGDERSDQLTSFIGVQIDLDRALALVQARPEEALSARRQRPAIAVQTAADLVEADHVRAQLGERHPAERRSDEGGALDHGQVVEDAGGHAA